MYVCVVHKETNRVISVVCYTCQHYFIDAVSRCWRMPNIQNGSIWDERRKEGKVLFNDALYTFYLRLYGVSQDKRRHICNTYIFIT